MDSTVALQNALQKQLSMQTAIHQDEIFRLHKTIDALKDAVKRRDNIIRQMLDESCSLADLPVLSSNCEQFEAPQSQVSLPSRASTLDTRPEAVQDKSKLSVSERKQKQTPPAAQIEFSSFSASAEIDEDDEGQLSKIASILREMHPISAKQAPQEIHSSGWCQWSRECRGCLLKGRTVDNVLKPGTSTLRREVPALFRGVSEVEPGSWRGVVRLRVGKRAAEVWGRHQREHPVMAALDADALERRVIPKTFLRRVNFAQEPGEWQVLGRRSHSSRVLLAQYLPAGATLPGAEPRVEDRSKAAPGQADAAASPQELGVSLTEWKEQITAAHSMQVQHVLEKQPIIADFKPLPPPLSLSPSLVADVLRFQTWVQPGVVVEEDGEQVLVTRSVRTRDHLPNVHDLIMADGRLYVGVLQGPKDDEWCLHVCGTGNASRRISRDVRFKDATALSVALLHDDVQRHIFKKPHGRRVNFAQEPGEWQIVPQRSCSHNARQLYVQYMPEATAGLPVQVAVQRRGPPTARKSKGAASRPKQAPAAGANLMSTSDLDKLSDEALLGTFAPPPGVDLRALTPPRPVMSDVRFESKWQSWLNMADFGGSSIHCTTARRPEDIEDEWELNSAKLNARLYVGIRLSAATGRVNITIVFRSAGGTTSRQREFAGSALQGALLHDRVQRLLLRDPSQRRVNFAVEEGEWQLVLQRDKPVNARQLFVQYMPSKAPQTRSAIQPPAQQAEAVTEAATEPGADEGDSPPAPKQARGLPGPSSASTPSSESLQRPPAALASAVHSEGVRPVATQPTETDDSVYQAWLEDIASRVTTDIVVPGKQDAAVAQYLAVAAAAAPRPTPVTPAARASLHHLVNGVERRLYRCIRSSPTVSGQFALRGQLASLLNEQTFDTPYAAALAADEAVRRSVQDERCRLVNFKQPGSAELQYLPCSRNLRVSVYAAAPQLTSPSGTTGPTARSNGGGKRGRSA